MKPSNIAGFTIIETMLFLGISGLLIMGVLVGTGNSINTQRYRDSVTSLQSVIQKQYFDVANVSNDSMNNDCYGDDTAGNPRGQSNCVMLGRYITTGSDSKLLIKRVIGYEPAGLVLLSDDVDVFNQYSIRVLSVLSETYEIEWGASAVDPRTSRPMNFSVLILRSPASGIIRTFINPTQVIHDSAISGLLDGTNLSKSVEICLDSNGMLTGKRMSVNIKANATSASSIETPGENSQCQ